MILGRSGSGSSAAHARKAAALQRIKAAIAQANTLIAQNPGQNMPEMEQLIDELVDAENDL